MLLMFFPFSDFFQLQPMTLARWVIESPDPEHPGRLEYFPLPKGQAPKYSDEDKVMPTVVVLGIAGCHCRLIEAWEKKEIIVPEGLKRVDLWSSDSDNGRLKDPFEDKMYRIYFPGLLEDAEKKVRKKFI